jgi:DNA-binding beta-propeller fold protein YncE
MPLQRIKNLMEQTASALAFAHSRGVVHRDVKPANIMVVNDDQVKVTDFGIARVLRRGATLHTMTGTTVGTPLYMAPEQIEGAKVDGRADIYALGAVMYEMVTNRPPFTGGDAVSIAFKHVHSAPQPPRELREDLPRDWEALILKALAKNPADRFQTASAMQEALASLGVDGTPRARTVSSTLASIGRRDPDVSRTPAERPPVGAATLATGTVTPIAKKSSDVQVEQGTGRAAGLPWRRLAVIGLGIVLVLVIAGIIYKVTSASSPPPTTTPRGSPGATVLGLRPVLSWGRAGSNPGLFRDPEGVAVDRAGDVYVADYGNDRIQKFSPNGKPLAVWGQAGTSPGQFNGPTGVAVDTSGNVYVADANNNRIQKLSSAGQPLALWGSAGSGAGQLRGPHGLAVDSKGDIYVADYSNNRIAKYSSGGRLLADWGGPAPGSAPRQFDGPVSLAVDGHGNVYVADFYNNRIQNLSSQGDSLAQFTQWGKTGTGFARPHGVAIDSHGNIYVADYANNQIQVLSPAGKPVDQLGRPGHSAGQFDHPVGLAIDSQGNLYVADAGNNRIQKFSPRG